MLNNYLLNESIIPIKTLYGTNEQRNNNKFLEFDNFVVTFFEQNKLYYIVGLDTQKGDIRFGVSSDDTLNPNEYDDSRFITQSPTTVFGKVFYTILRIVEYTNINQIQFDSANFALGKIYDKLVKNKYFLQSLENNGFQFSGMQDNKYVFTRKHKG